MTEPRNTAVEVDDRTSELILAAGGLVIRRSKPDRVEIAIVHRPIREDWSYPKGKVEPKAVSYTHLDVYKRQALRSTDTDETTGPVSQGPAFRQRRVPRSAPRPGTRPHGCEPRGCAGPRARCRSG